MILAVIPARGGSKRIPGKNIRPFAGTPIIAHTIAAAQRSSLFDRIVVSTDDEQIAEVARSFGAETPFRRPSPLADDYTGTNAVVKHCLQWFDSQGVSFEAACCLYATAPLLQVRYLEQGLDTLRSSGRPFAFSVTSFAYPVQRGLRIGPQGVIELLDPRHASARSQDLEEAFHDAGQFYWGRPEAFLNDRSLWSRSAAPVIVPRHLVQDIDTPEDWQRAEYMYLSLKQAGEIAS